jgi:lysophospholipase L1-like esterase
LRDSSQIKYTDYGLVVPCPKSVSTISIKVTCAPGKHFTFYGLNIEKIEDKGVIYHSTGVGAAAIRSILYLDKLEQQLPVIEPDIVFLDFGTNDILYTNKIDPSLPGQVQKAITKIKSIRPEVLIVLTSTQDLFYKGKIITAGPIFRDLMDSIARANNCLFWNWYDLSGGIGTIKTWANLGYAQTDGIHLTTKGYHLKGLKIFESFENTLLKIKEQPTRSSLVIQGKNYQSTDTLKINPGDEIVLPPKKPLGKTYTVKSGDTLSKIAQKYHVSIASLKRKNKLKGDMIRIGQKLKIP